jgi:hypothetical protein
MRVNLEVLVAIVALALLALAAGYWLLSSPGLAAPGVPTYNGEALRHLEAAVPQVDAFEQFYVNNDNPFVPYHMRVTESTQLGPKRVRPPPKPPVPPTKPPVKVVEVQPPALKLPRLTAAGATAPQCIGLIGGGDDRVLMVRMPTADAAPLAIGESVDGWKLIAIDNANQARFTDPDGIEQVFPIGDGDLASAQTPATTAPAPKSATPGPGKPPGGGALLPGGPPPKAPPSGGPPPKTTPPGPLPPGTVPPKRQRPQVRPPGEMQK